MEDDQNPQNLRYLFLDIDGVLNGNREYQQWRKLSPRERYSEKGALLLLNRDKVKLINRITRAAGAEIILSSSWRLDPRLDTPTLLQKAGLEAPVVGKTGPELSGIEYRGQEIKAKVLEMGLEADQYFILDDDWYAGHGVLELGHQGRFFRTSDTQGLLKKNLPLITGLFLPG